MKLKYLIFFPVIIYLSCNTFKKSPVVVPAAPVTVIITQPDTIQTIPKMKKTDAFLEDLLKSRPDEFSHIIENRDSFKVQIIYTQIDRTADNEPVFKPYYFNVDPDEYFYPASTVKMPVAVMALQRLNELRVYGLNSASSMISRSDFSGQTAVYNDPTTADGRPSVAHYIKKIFLTSDNDAFNRLYEFLGQQYINEQLQKKDYLHAQILHRLSVALTEEENRHTNPVQFFNTGGRSLFSQPMQVNTRIYPKRHDSAGRAYYLQGRLVNEPMDFSKKNKVSLENLTSILKSILFPDAVPEKHRFNLTPEDHHFVWKYMSQLLSESTYPSYDSSVYQDAYVKFLMYGSEKGAIPKHIRIFNKVGDAYGFLTDVAYIVDFEKNVEFMLSATIYCNSDGVLNDDNYEYETTGFPFMKHLGKLIYDYETTRNRIRQPDLSKFRIAYDR